MTKKDGGKPTDSYTCYDKPLPPTTTTLAPETTPGVTTIPPSVAPDTVTPTTAAVTTVPPSEAPETTTPTSTGDGFIQFEHEHNPLVPESTTPEATTVPPTTTTPTTTGDEEFIESEFPVPEPSPEPGVIEDCCGNDVEADALEGTCFSKITDLPLDTLHGRELSDTFEDNVYMSYYKYYLESCTFGEDCTYTELSDPDPQHHKFKVGKSRVKIEAYDIAGNKYECMRNVYVHDMQPPKFVYGEFVHEETSEPYQQEFSPDSLTVRLEVDKETCNIKASETFSKYETLQGGGSGHDVTAIDNCDVVRAGDNIGAEVMRKIYDANGTIIFDSSSENFTDETLLTTGPGSYKMEIIAIDDYSDDITFPSNRSADTHKSVLTVDLELYDEAPPSGISACPADMIGEKEVLIGPNETEAVVFLGDSECNLRQLPTSQ